MMLGTSILDPGKDLNNELYNRGIIKINTVHLNYGLSGLNRRVRLGMNGKVEKIGFDLININSANPKVQMNCVPFI